MNSDNREVGTVIGVVILMGLIIIGSVSGYFFITMVGAGETGVKFNLLADGVQENEFGEGIHIKAPWVKIDKFNTRTQEYTMSKIVNEGTIERDDRVRTVTSEGLYVDLDITVLYKIVPDKANIIRQTIGTEGEYQEIIIRPTVRNAVREVISKYEAMDIYSEKRGIIEEEIYSVMHTQLIPRNIIIEDMLIRDVEIPKELSTAIEAKKTAEQLVLEMEYVLETEEKIKAQRIIEAEGISEANEIIAGSLTDEYLTWYWIDRLDTHDSVIYVPIGESGLPLFREVTEE